jgi:hypothetical protein
MNEPNTGRRRRLGTFAAFGAAALIASFAIASTASAAPKGIFAKYGDCPTATPGVALCTYAETTSGEFAIGSTKVPITKTIVLQGGAVHAGGANFNEYVLVPAKDGNTLSKTPLSVPGGLSGLVNCTEIKGNGLLEILERGSCKAIFENGVTGVSATTELVATSTDPAILNLTNLVEEKGTALTLPVRVHLSNPLLGEACYVGSTAHPITLHLTDGTTAPPPPNKPIKGSLGEPTSEVEKGYESTVIVGNSLVDNAFSAPVAEGCGGAFAFLIDPILDAKLGLPSAAGKNTAVLKGTLRTAEAEAVLASEGF